MGRRWRLSPLLRMRTLKGFTLVDVLIALTLSSFLLILVFSFLREVMIFSTFIARHEKLRRETFTLLHFAIGPLIREAVAIDYEHSTPQKLSLFMDKFERPESTVIVALERSSEEGHERSQLVLMRGNEKMYLHSPSTVITDFQFEYPVNPKGAKNLQIMRAFQPIIRVAVKARFKESRVSYQAAYTLRNYSFSNLRSE